MPHWSVSHAVEDALWDAARASLPRGVLVHKGLIPAVIARSEMYTTDREHLAAAGKKPGAADLAARALFFGVADAAKISIPLGELERRGVLPSRDVLRIADVGAGAGAMTLGAIDFLGGRRVDVVAIDRDVAALELMRAAVANLSEASRVSCERRNVVGLSLDPGRFDLVLAGTVLNELDPAERHRLVRAMVAGLADGGAAIIVEPALRETSRALHEVRDRVIADGVGHVFAPCTQQTAPCPMLADERDWCHEDRPTQLPPRAARIAQVTGLRTGGLKFSYLVIRRQSDPLVAGDGPALRVVSQMRRSKGKRECFACGDGGRVELRLPKKNRSDANRAFERAKRGDVAVTTATGTIGRDESVELIHPAG